MSFDAGVKAGMEKVALSPETMGSAWAERIQRTGGRTSLDLPGKKARLYERAVKRLYDAAPIVKGKGSMPSYPSPKKARRMTMTMIRKLKNK